MVKLRYIIVIVLILALIGLMAYRAYASSVGPNSCGTGADNAGTGTIAWTNPQNGCGADTTYASIVAGSGNSHYLTGTNLGFSIPVGATINGIQMDFLRYRTRGDPTDTTYDNAIRLVKADGTFGASNLSTGIVWPLNTPAYASYGSSSELWGETWTASNIDSANFGGAVSAGFFTSTSANGYIDNIRITVYYTLPSGTPQVQVRSGNVNIKSGSLILK